MVKGKRVIGGSKHGVLRKERYVGEKVKGGFGPEILHDRPLVVYPLLFQLKRDETETKGWTRDCRRYREGRYRRRCED